MKKSQIDELMQIAIDSGVTVTLAKGPTEMELARRFRGIYPPTSAVECLSDMHRKLDALIADTERRLQARELAIEAYLAELGETPFQSGSRAGWTLLVSRDPSKPTQWRVTRFEGEEPTGHTECATFRDCIRCVHDFGGKLPNEK